MMIREPAHAGMFYAASGAACVRDLEALFCGDPDPATIPEHPVGGIVPHAGWTYSGAVAARVLGAIAVRRCPSTFVVFGAVHQPMRSVASVFASGAWTTPLGEIAIDDRLADRIQSQTNLIEADPYAHEREHSIEVQVPLIQHRFPEARLLPVMVRPTDQAEAVGHAVGRTVAAYELDVAIIGSTDLTHYGTRFGFTPKGSGPEGLRWAKEVNDRRILDRMLAMDAGAVVPEVRAQRNACGAGAIAAAIAACRELGATRGHLLAHTTSAEVAPTESADAAVSYAAILFA